MVCVDEKSQIEALDRTAPNLPLRPGSPERRTHDYTRHGTTTLFAALEVATGRVTDQCFDRHRHGEFLAFLQLVAKAYPRRQLHVVLDNYGTHTHAAVKAWLARHPRIHLHFTPTSASWMNLVEVFFSIITRQAIRRGSFPSVPDLIAAIGRFVDGWNQRSHPFVWVKDADDIMVKATRKRTSGTNTSTDENTVVLLADFYRAGDGNDESFTAQMIVSADDIAPDIAGTQNAWIQGVGCASAIANFSS